MKQYTTQEIGKLLNSTKRNYPNYPTNINKRMNQIGNSDFESKLKHYRPASIFDPALIGTVGFQEIAFVGGWKELGRITTGSALSDFSVGSLADKRYYMVLQNFKGKSGVFNTINRMGNSTIDIGENYAFRYSNNGEAEATATERSWIQTSANPTNLPDFSIHYISNLSTKEKLHQIWLVNQEAAGATTAPERQETVSKWVNTASPMNIFGATTLGGSGWTISTGSEIVILGWDPADVHTTNFWELLDTVNLSGGAATSLTSNVFATKKYLWIQCYVDQTTTQNPAFRLGSTTLDTGSNYATRYSLNGAADGTLVSQTAIHGGVNTYGQFFNFFIINNASNEKLIIQHTVQQGTAGAGTVTQRAERVSKWVNTSNQADIFGLINSGTGNFGTNTIMNIYGSA